MNAKDIQDCGKFSAYLIWVRLASSAHRQRASSRYQLRQPSLYQATTYTGDQSEKTRQSHTMSTSKNAPKTEPTTKKFGKGQRTVPHPTKKAQKFYPVEDAAKPRKVCLT